MPTEARIYVGTYAKYNAGSIAGAWLDLEGHDADTFADACRELHADEADPELMYQDFEGFPREFYGESHIDPRLWEWLELDEREREIFAAYVEDVNQDGTPEEARDAYAGTFDSPAAWAEEFLADTHPAFSPRDKENEILVRYFGYEAYAHDAGIDSVHFVERDGETLVFWR